MTLLLGCMSCIYYPIWFKKDWAKIQILLDSGSEVNTITLVYIAQLGFKDQSTNVKAQEINNSIFKTFEVVLVNFQVNSKLNKAQFFQNNFLLVNTSMDVVLSPINDQVVFIICIASLSLESKISIYLA